MRIALCLLSAGVMLLLLPRYATAAPPAPATVSSQGPAKVLQELRLNDGSRLYGYEEGSEEDTIRFRTIDGGLIEIDREKVVSIAPAVGRVVRGEFLPADPNATRLFFWPTGRALRQGEGYLGILQVGLPIVQVGVTDRVSIGAGTPLFLGVGGESRPFWITPKVQLYEGRTSVATGVIHVSPGEGSFGIAYAVATYGHRDNAVTAGVGYAYARYEGEREATIIAMAGGELRVSKRVKFITENYVGPGFGIVIAGVRFLGERLSADLGLMTPIFRNGPVAVPVVNVVWKF